MFSRVLDYFKPDDETKGVVLYFYESNEIFLLTAEGDVYGDKNEIGVCDIISSTTTKDADGNITITLDLEDCGFETIGLL